MICIRMSVLTLMVFAVLSTCSQQEPDSSYDFEKVKSVKWRLVEIQTVDRGTITPESADTIWIVFENKSVVKGDAAGKCGNRYSGVYHIAQTNSLRMDSLTSTEELCPESAYWTFLNTLEGVASFRVEERELSLYDATSHRMLFQKES